MAKARRVGWLPLSHTAGRSGTDMFDSTLTETEWRDRRAAYLDRVRPWALDRMRRAGRQQKHPVYDFLFEYYSLRPSYLLRWSPGVAVRLEGATPDDLDWRPW